MPYKTWKAGDADEVWKVIICARDIEYGKECLSKLRYILTDTPHDFEKGNELLRQMSGKEIIDGLEKYIESCEKSVAKAVKRNSGGLG